MTTKANSIYDDKATQFAFVLYDTVANAQKAIQSFDGSNVFGGHSPIVVEMW